MKRKLIFILILFLAINFSSFAQKNKVRFHSINSFALIAGESGYSTAFQTVNGIHFSNWFSGIGIGVDNYKYKTLPLFFDARKYFGSEKRAFVYGDIGYDFPMKNKPGKEVYYNDSYKFTGGIYTDVGIGFQFHLSKRSFVLFNLGYSWKKLECKTGVVTCPLIGPCYIDYNKYNFSFNRMILKAGLLF